MPNTPTPKREAETTRRWIKVGRWLIGRFGSKTDDRYETAALGPDREQR